VLHDGQYDISSWRLRCYIWCIQLHLVHLVQPERCAYLHSPQCISYTALSWCLAGCCWHSSVATGVRVIFQVTIIFQRGTNDSLYIVNKLKLTNTFICTVHLYSRNKDKKNHRLASCTRLNCGYRPTHITASCPIFMPHLNFILNVCLLVSASMFKFIYAPLGQIDTINS